jgi:2-polyprenyl-6-methoxyphenol hydroxylase-like FAD-dependent oxidoreductase
MAPGNDHAVVIGASMGGLLAARVLSEHYGAVTLLDRDTLPERAVGRGGVPHGRHTHGLLAGGRQAMEQLFPGLTDDLVVLGALRGDLQGEGRWYLGERPLARAASGHVALACSRWLLEWYVRRRVTALPSVQVRDATVALDLAWHSRGALARGVLVADRDATSARAAAHELLPADLVVDASGRTSRLPDWLQRRGHPRPAREAFRVDVSYATRIFRREPGALDGDLALVVAATPERPRAAAVLAQEGDRWTVSLSGYFGERPPLDLQEYVAQASRYGLPELHELVAGSEPLDDGVGYRFASARRHRFDRARDLPDNVVAVGDAVCSFDPVFGQGMSVAALEAVQLGACLEEGSAELARRYFRRTRPIVDVPWTVATGSTLELPGSPVRAPLATRAVNRYLRSYQRAATDDAELAAGFLGVANLTSGPSTLFAPGRVARVLARNGRRPARLRPLPAG